MGLEQSGAERRSCPPVGWLSLMSLDERRCVFFWQHYKVENRESGWLDGWVVRWLLVDVGTSHVQVFKFIFVPCQG